MKIAIVNDLQLEIEVLKKALLPLSDIEIIWTAINGKEAVIKTKTHKPDLILMNLIMPVMDGAMATSVIMDENPVAIMIVTSSVEKNQSKVFNALGNGALDVVVTPYYDRNGNLCGTEDLIRKIQTISKIINANLARINSEFFEANAFPKSKLIAIGSSTGGPKALSFLLQNLPQKLDVAIAIIQHVDNQFAQGLANWLGTYTKHKVKIAENNEEIKNGVIYVAGTNDHLIVAQNQKFAYTPEPFDYPYRPSVDAFFNSIAENWKKKSLAILLTGMGNDGAKGLLKLRQSGWTTLAQDKESSVVWGMPKAALEFGAVSEVNSLFEISKKLNKYIS